MSAPQNGPQEGQQGTGDGQQGSGGSSGSSGAGEGQQGTGSGSPGAGAQQGQQQTQRRSYADVLADLDDDTRAVVLAEMAKKNGEARNQRQRAKDAEAALARLGGPSQPQEGQQGTGNGEQGNGSQQRQQQPREGQQQAGGSDTQLANARVAVARSKVEAIAATAGFADPEDAVALLGDLGGYVDTDFSVDGDSISTDVEALLTEKPHLRRADGSQGAQRPGRPAPDRSQGSSANGQNGQRTGVDAGADLYRQRHARRDGASASTS